MSQLLKPHTWAAAVSIDELDSGGFEGYPSKAMTLLPSDILLTGTPAGVGPVEPGDVVEIEIGGIGLLRNAVVADTHG